MRLTRMGVSEMRLGWMESTHFNLSQLEDAKFINQVLR